MTTRKLCVDCDRRFAVLCGLCSLCHARMLADIAARRKAYLEGEDVRIDAAFDRAITQAPYAFAAPDRDHGKPTGRTLLLHPACYAECAAFYDYARPMGCV